jgi:Domain of unknown function (DUF4395)
MQQETKRNFILQQGFAEPDAGGCSRLYSGLQFQPRVILVWVLAGIVLQSLWLFAALGVVLWWNALLPKRNLFDAAYNATAGRRAGAVRLNPAPAPRRTAQAMAGAFALGCALLLHYGLMAAAYAVEGIFVAAILALLLGAFCMGSLVHHLLTGRAGFARRTLPWAR